jgi:kynureninase
MEQDFDTGEGFALGLDISDPLSGYRERFYIPPDTIYMDGNSLGLLSKNAERSIHRVVHEWKEKGITGWLDGEIPWFYLAELLGEMAAPLVGADPVEVVATATTTFNIHTLVSTLYRPRGNRTKIIASSLDFPTDIYALRSQIELRGLHPADELILVSPGSDGYLEESAVIDLMSESVSLIMLPSVLYRSGQLLDMQTLTEAAHRHGIIAGFDCSHSVGIIPHHFDRWDVDFAVWCSYKYLNGGPGSPAFLYLNRRHFDRDPALAGWFGYVKEKQFDMSLEFEHARCAGGWQVSSPGILGAAAVRGALEVTLEARIDRIREKSLAMTEYLIFLTDALLGSAPYDISIGTPRETERRGGHVALVRNREAMRIKEALIDRGVIPDFRPPDIIRIAPVPLYNTYHEIWRVVRILREIIDRKSYENHPEKRKLIP